MISGLLTGNSDLRSRNKLTGTGLDIDLLDWSRSYFGSRSPDRISLACGARRQIPTTGLLIIGDTPIDGIAAAAASIPFLALCTGKYRREAFAGIPKAGVLDELKTSSSQSIAGLFLLAAQLMSSAGWRPFPPFPASPSRATTGRSVSAPISSVGSVCQCAERCRALHHHVDRVLHTLHVGMHLHMPRRTSRRRAVNCRKCLCRALVGIERQRRLRAKLLGCAWGRAGEDELNIVRRIIGSRPNEEGGAIAPPLRTLQENRSPADRPGCGNRFDRTGSRRCVQSVHYRRPIVVGRRTRGAGIR